MQRAIYVCSKKKDSNDNDIDSKAFGALLNLEKIISGTSESRNNDKNLFVLYNVSIINVSSFGEYINIPEVSILQSSGLSNIDDIEQLFESRTRNFRTVLPENRFPCNLNQVKQLLITTNSQHVNTIAMTYKFHEIREKILKGERVYYLIILCG
ncbi:hypothetical protein BDA99DRAFT_542282 [Phascolomyces articulosus]|uniref:Uncharacterized protein n=1 Tax=Phascolomyces articulosus TaxID=60185 RepID=A0AAD5K3G6_9FUNG|nr:hypothetical protein BDA99DRAFT_542282 [Phascolomyces articulosus]